LPPSWDSTRVVTRVDGRRTTMRVTDLLKHDHEEVKGLFTRLE
jgi:hypothetical protein